MPLMVRDGVPREGHTLRDSVQPPKILCNRGQARHEREMFKPLKTCRTRHPCSLDAWSEHEPIPPLLIVRAGTVTAYR
jgi:hypothetical protein